MNKYPWIPTWYRSYIGISHKGTLPGVNPCLSPEWTEPMRGWKSSFTIFFGGWELRVSPFLSAWCLKKKGDKHILPNGGLIMMMTNQIVAFRLPGSRVSDAFATEQSLMTILGVVLVFFFWWETAHSWNPLYLDVPLGGFVRIKLVRIDQWVSYHPNISHW